ncbi:MAG: hypothetical protein V4478_01105 [Patescibacteria group bacterium]
MIISTDKALLFIEPQLPPTEKPLIDSLTRKMTWSLHHYVETGSITANPGVWQRGVGFMGGFACSCGNAISGGQDLKLPSGFITNTLAVHYLAYHRHEISHDALEIIEMFECPEQEPTELELNYGCN